MINGQAANHSRDRPRTAKLQEKIHDVGFGRSLWNWHSYVMR
jgi:hypothetical protein